MTTLSRNIFLKSLPDVVIPRLPESYQAIQVNQPWRWLIQFHFGEPRLHYEVSRVAKRKGWEIGFHCEARDRQLNRFLLDGFRRHLFEIKDKLGDSIEAEMWDRGWTKIYEVVPEKSLTTTYQEQVGHRLADMIICIHPIFVDLRGRVRNLYR